MDWREGATKAHACSIMLAAVVLAEWHSNLLSPSSLFLSFYRRRRHEQLAKLQHFNVDSDSGTAFLGTFRVAEYVFDEWLCSLRRSFLLRWRMKNLVPIHIGTVCYCHNSWNSLPSRVVSHAMDRKLPKELSVALLRFLSLLEAWACLGGRTVHWWDR